MAHKIGSYVHYTMYGYKGIGIQRSPFITEAELNIKQTHDMVDENIRRMNNRKMAQDLQDLLNRVFNINGDYTNADGQDIYEKAFKAYIERAEGEIGEDLFKIVEEGYSRGRVDRKTGLIKFENVAARGRKKVNVSSLKTSLNKVYESLVQEINRLQLTDTNINNAHITFGQALDNIRKDIEKIKQIDTTVSTMYPWKDTDTDRSVQNISLYLKMGNAKNQTVFTQGRVLNQITRLVQIVNAKLLSAEVIGKSLEAGVEGTLQYLIAHRDKFVEDSVIATMKSANRIGDNATTKGYRDKLFSIDVKLEDVINNKSSKEPKTIKIDGENYHIISDLKTKDKADIIITFESGQTQYLSLKNSNNQVTKDQGLKLVMNSPLLYMIQNYNAYNFVNHYLNYISALKVNREQQGRTTPTMADYTNMLHRAMKKEMQEIILLNALTQLGAVNVDGNISGYPGLFLFRETYGAKNNKYFKEQFKVVTMYDLFYNLMSSPEEYINMTDVMEPVIYDQKMWGTTTASGTLITAPTKLGYQEKANKRITWLLAQIHQRKVTVRITLKGVKDFLRNEQRSVPKS